MKLIKLGGAVLNQTPRDWSGNLANILTAIQMAKEQKVSVLCLPEMAITGYGLEDDLFCKDVPERALKKLAELLPHCKDIIVAVGLPVIHDNALFNAVAVIVDAKVKGFVCKQHLAGDGIHYEPRHFKPWPTGVTSRLISQVIALKQDEIDDDPEWGMFMGADIFPLGDLHFQCKDIKIGFEICEDAWVANRPGAKLAAKGVDIILNPSGSHFSFGKLNTRRNFVVDASRAYNCAYVYTNLVGNEAGRAIYDGGAIIASGGKLVALGKRFTYHNVLLTTAVVDIDSNKTAQVRSASFQPNIEEYTRGCIGAYFEWPEVFEPLTEGPTDIENWELSPDVKHHECTRAIGLALMDYMRKSHTKGFAVSLSGGADSAAVTFLAAMGIKLGIEELGPHNFIQKYCPHLGGSSLTSEHAITNKLISTAYQPTRNSGVITREAAEQVADGLWARFYVLEVDGIFDEYLKLAKFIQGRDADYKTDNIALQNLQARLRAPGIWFIANVQGKLLLTTSNMSEAAVGYATMDGDTAGCVAPIAGLPKVYIREYLKWAEGITPALSYVNKQQPTAELLPSEFHQTDETDLMPYDLLHKIEKCVVMNRYTPLQTYQALRPTCEGNKDSLVKYIVKFYKLFSINQWKRERYALSFHMDDHNLDPRTWCRTPILTGGYQEELAELERVASNDMKTAFGKAFFPEAPKKKERVAKVT